MEILTEISTNLQAGNDEGVADSVSRAIEEGIPAAEILDSGLIAGMNVVGEGFRDHTIFLPEVLLAARAMTRGVDLLKPLLIAEEVPSRGRVVLGSIEGDLHDIGKNLVGIMLKGAGFEVVDLGIDVPPERFVETAVAEGASVIGVSALLTTTMARMKEVVQILRERELGSKVSLIVGGAPLSLEFARSIGADGYAYDAANAVEKVNELVAKHRTGPV